jgi:hypothetical protein
MACPQCGGTDRRAISRGFWECTSLVYGSVPTGLHPSGRFGPVFQTVANPCGRRYQDGASGGTGMLCQTCTIFAIGICADCGIPQCGENCGRHYRGAFLCAQCRKARAMAEQAAGQAAAQKAAAEIAQQRAVADAAAAQLADAWKAWLRAVVRTLEAGVRQTHREGWAIGPATAESVKIDIDTYRGYTSTIWRESQLIVTSNGELQTYMRSKPRKTSLRWSNKWTVPATHVRDRSAIAAYIRTQYGVSVPQI